MKFLAHIFFPLLLLTGQAYAQCDSVMATASPSQICIGDPVVFNLQVPLGATILIDSVLWDFGDGDSSQLLTAVHTYTSPGVYSVTATIDLDEVENPCPQVILPITVNDTPHVDITASANTGCATDTLTFVNNSFSNQGPPLGYLWSVSPLTGISFVSGTTTNSSEPEIEFSQTGTYTVSVEVFNDCDTILQTFPMVIDTLPTAGMSISADSICLGDAVQFTFTGGYPGTDSTLDLGDGSPLVQNPNSPFTHLYTSTGTYTILYIVNNACGSDTAIGTVTVLEEPTAILAASDTVICQGDLVTFTFNGGFPGTDSTFDPGDGSGLIQLPTSPYLHTYTNPGTYTATYTVSNFCGTSIESVIIEVESLPVISLSLSQDTICTDGSASLSYSYSPVGQNDIDTLFIICPSVTDTITSGNSYAMPTDSGSCIIIYKVSNDCGTVSDTLSLEVVGPPTAAVEPFLIDCMFGISPTLIGPNTWRQCNGIAGSVLPICLEIQDYNPNYTYNWQFTYQGTITNVTSPPGSEFDWSFGFGTTDFSVTVVDSASGCQDQWSGTIFYQSNPQFDLDFCTPSVDADCNWSPPNICEGDTVYFFPNVDSVQLTNLDTICIDWGDNTPLEFYFKEDGYPSVFKHVYQIENDSSYICDPFTGQVSYNVTGIGKNSCGTNTATNQVFVQLKPTPELVVNPPVTCVPDVCFDFEVCPDPILFITSPTDSIQMWFLPDTSYSTPIAIPYPLPTNFCWNYDSISGANGASGPGVYHAVFWTDVLCGQKFDTVEVRYVDSVQLNMDFTLSDSLGCGPQIVSFEDSSFAIGSPPLGYSWTVSPNFGVTYLNGTDSTSASPVIQLDGPATYTIIVEVTGFCDVVVESFVIPVFAQPSIGLSLTADTICLNDCVTFDISSDVTNTVLTFSSFTAGGPTFSPPPAFPYTECYNTAGVYQIQYIEQNICGADTATAELVVNDEINPSLTYDVTDGCIPLEVQVTNNSTITQGPPLTYLWNVTGVTGFGNDPAIQGIDWDFLSGGNTSVSPQFSFESAGTYTVCVSIFGICDTLTLCQTIEARDGPTVFLTPALSDICLGDSVTFTYGTSNFTNALGTQIFDPQPFASQSPPLSSPQTFIYTTPGTFPITFTEINVCDTAQATAQVVVRDTIHPNVNFDLTDACAPYQITVTDSSFVLTGGPISYLWSGPGLIISDPLSPTPTITVQQAGTYTLCVTMTGDCDSKTICQTIIGREAPEVELLPDSSVICLQECIDFTTQSLNFTNALTSNLFDPGFGTPFSIGAAPDTFQVCYDSVGIYQIVYTETNVCGSHSDTSFVEVRDTIHAQVSVDTTAGCVPFAINYTNTSFVDQGSPLSYLWTITGGTFVGGTDSTSASPQIEFTQAGTYVVCLSIFGDCDTVLICDTIQARDLPLVQLMPDSSIICLQECIDFTTQSLNFTNALTSNLFDPGFGTPFSIGAAPDTFQVCYDSVGIYQVIYTETNVCGSHSDTSFVEVRDTIHVDVSVDTTAGCVPFAINYTNTSFVDQGSPLSYLWTITGGTFVGGTDSTSASPQIEFTQAGTYVVCLSIFGDCDTVLICDTIQARDLPLVQLLPDSSVICLQECIDFTTQSLNFTNALTSNLFDPGFGTPFSIGAAPDTFQVCYDSVGIYQVVYTETNVCGTHSDTSFVEVRDTIHVDVSVDTTAGCVPFAINYTNTSFVDQGSPLSYLWTITGGTFVGGTDSTSASPQIEFTQAGTHVVCLSIFGDCDTVLICDTIQARDLPLVQLLPDSSVICLQECIDFTTQSLNFTNALTSNLFDPGFGTPFSIGAAPDTFQVCYDSVGIYQVIYTETNVCGTHSDTSFVEVRDTIHAQVSVDTTAGCVPFTINYTNTSFVDQGSPLSYLWTITGGTFVGGTDSTSASPQIEFTQAGAYVVCLSIFGDCDTVLICDTIQARDLPLVQLLPDSSVICLQECIDFTTQSLNFTNALTSNLFDPGFGTPFSIGAAPDTFQVCYDSVGIYQVVYTETNVCGTHSDTSFVEVRDTIHVDVSVDTTAGCVPFAINYTNTSFVDQGSPLSYLWTITGGTFVGGTDSTSASPQIEFTQAGTYVVCLSIFGDCDTVLICDTIQARDLPLVQLLPDSSVICLQECIDFTTQSLNFTNALTSNLFDPGFGTPFSIGAAPDTFQVCYDSVGIYQIVYTETNVCGSHSDTSFVEVRDTIHAQVSVDTTAGCVPFAINYTNTSFVDQGSPLSYLWTITGGTFVGGTDSTSASPQIEFTQAGTYVVCLSIFGDCDTVLICDTIQARDLPLVQLLPDSSVICLQECIDFTTQSLNFTNALTSNLFDPGFGTPFSIGAAPDTFQVCYDSVGIYQIVYTETNVCGSHSDTSFVEVRDTIHVDVSVDTTAGCVPFAINYTNTSFVDQGSPLSYLWTITGGTFVGGTDSTSASPQIEFTQAGTYVVCLSIFGDCDTVLICDTIQARDLPLVQLLPDSSVICLQECIDFTTQSLNFTNALTSNLFDPGFGTPFSIGAAPDTFQVCYDSVGIYQVIYTETNVCGSHSDTSFVEVRDTIHVDVSVDTTAGCVPFAINYTNTSFVDQGSPLSYLWTITGGTFVGGTDSTSASPQIEFTQAGTYVVCLSIFGDCDTVLICDTIQARDLPLVQLMPDSSIICLQECIDFTTQSLNFTNALTSNLFDPGFGTPFSIGAAPDTFQVCYDSVGIYQVIYTETNVCGTHSDTSFVEVRDTIHVDVSVDTTAGCIPFTISTNNNSFTTQGTILGYSWTVDGQISSPTNTWSFVLPGSNTIAEPLISFDSAGIYIVCVDVFGECDTATFCDTVIAIGLPMVELFPIPDTCGQMDLFLSTANVVYNGTITDYSWDFGSGIPGDSVAFPSGPIVFGVDTHTVMIVVENQCGADSSSQTFIVEPPIPADAGPDTIESCLTDGCIPISGTPAGGFWTLIGPNDGSTIVGGSQFCPANADTYLLTYTFGEDYCEVSDTLVVVVHPQPVAAFAADVEISCGIPATVTFGNLSIDAISYSWTFPTGTPSTSTTVSPSVVFTELGSHVATLIAVSQFGCADTITDTISVIPQPIPDLLATPAEGCAPLDVTFTNASMDYTGAILIPGDNSPPMVMTGPVTHTYNSDQSSYQATLIVDQQGVCFDSVTVTINVDVGATADFTPAILSGDSCAGPMVVEFRNRSEEASGYLWDFGPQLGTSTQESPTITYLGPGIYPVTLIAFHEFGCADTARDTIEVFDQPEALFVQGNITGCAPVEVQLQVVNELGITEWAWAIGDSVFSTEATPTLVLDSAGSYDIRLTVSNQGRCRDAFLSRSHITVRPLPVAEFTYEDEITGGAPSGAISFINLSTGATSYQWDFGDSIANPLDNVSTRVNPTHTYTENGTYEVLLVAANQYGCVDSFTQPITPDGFCGLFIPNAFMPEENLDGYEVFKPVGAGLREFHIAVYDPFGELIWESTALENGIPSESWDGKINGVLANPDAYVWRVHKAICEDGSVWPGMKYEAWQSPKRYGTVTLIR